eukprot:2023867-Rhodomonas_salina.1
MPGNDLAYGATRLSCSTAALAWYCAPTCLRAPYAMPGTDAAYRAMRYQECIVDGHIHTSVPVKV